MPMCFIFLTIVTLLIFCSYIDWGDLFFILRVESMRVKKGSVFASLSSYLYFVFFCCLVKGWRGADLGLIILLLIYGILGVWIVDIFEFNQLFHFLFFFPFLWYSTFLCRHFSISKISINEETFKFGCSTNSLPIFSFYISVRFFLSVGTSVGVYVGTFSWVFLSLAFRVITA